MKHIIKNAQTFEDSGVIGYCLSFANRQCHTFKELFNAAKIHKDFIYATTFKTEF